VPNTTHNPYPNIPLPAGATSAFEWDDTGAGPYRYFMSRPWTVERADRGTDPVQVHIAGIQRLDGRVQREICVSGLHADNAFTPEQARRLVAALTAAIDKAEQLAKTGQ
jgi:hypothetical protein